MTAASRPEAIDSRLVLHIYACVTIPAGLVGYMWPVLVGMTDTSAWFANGRVAAAAVAAVGCCATGLGAIDDPVGRRRGLIGFAHAHILFGALLMAQSIAVRSATIPAPLAGVPVTMGLVLMYLAITGPGADFRGPLPALVPFDSKTTRNTRLMVRNKRSISYLRSQYEHDIRQAARQEERARLARDLHDAVKQQLFVIQTAAATAQARFDSDASGAKTAVDQVRAAAREDTVRFSVPVQQQPYLKPYARRAIAWSVVLISSIVYVAVGARAPGTWLPATVVLIAGIAVARYAVAAYRLRRSVAA